MKRFFVHIKLLSIVLVLLISISYFIIPVYAVSETEIESKIDTELSLVLHEVSDDEMISVSIWFEDVDKDEIVNETKEYVENLIDNGELPQNTVDIIDDVTAQIDSSCVDLSVEEVQGIIEEKRFNSKEAYTEYNISMLENILVGLSNFNLIYNCRYAPNIIIETIKSNIYILGDNDCVETIYYYQDDFFELSGSDYSNGNENISAINMPECLDAIGSCDDLTGDGVKIGTIEGLLSNRNADTLKNTTNPIVYDSNVDRNYYTDHATIVASILVGNCDGFLGMVPDAQLYSTCVRTPGGWKAGIEWLLDNGVNIINISSPLIVDRPTGSNDASRWIDHVSYQHSVTVVVSVGYSSPSVGYDVSPFVFSNNIIVVGAVNLEAANDGYVFTEYNSSAYSLEGRYYPHVVAPANPGYIPMCNAPAGGNTGNSFSAPFVTGAVAQLIEAQPSLATNPTLIKSIIMVGANGEVSEVNLNSSGIVMDRKYGAGVVNVQRSLSCLSTDTVQKTYTAFVEPNDNIITNLTLTVNESGYVRAALNWQSKNEFASNDTSHEISEDLICYGQFSFYQLQITAPNGDVHTSFDVSNPFQLLEFFVPEDNLGQYSVTLSRFGPGSYNTYVALAVYGGYSVC